MWGGQASTSVDILSSVTKCSSPDLSFPGFAGMFRRIRKPNYSHEETMALLEQIDAHRHILFGKSTNHQRSELWAFIADTVNAVPNSTGRTVEELKHRWKDLSHKTRISIRNFSEAKTSNDQPFVAPSIYFDIIMRILGDGISDRSDFNMQSCHDGQSSSPRFADDGHNFSASSEVDVKPDINIINRFIIGDSKQNILKMNLNPTSASSILVGKYPSTSNQNQTSSNDIHQFNPTSSINFIGSPQRSCISDPSNQQTPEEKHLQVNEHISSSVQNGIGTSSAGKSFLLRPQMQVSNLRPMRLDPVTQEITEVDGLDLDSDSSEDGSLCSKLTGSAAAERLVSGGVNVQENADNSASSLPCDPARKLTTNSLSMPSLSVEDLKKLYLMKKIKMIGHRTRCFRLLEQKFKCEINLLQQQATSGSQPSFHRNSPNPKVSRLVKNYKGDQDNGNLGPRLQEFESKQRQSVNDSCRQTRTVDSYCNDVNTVDNDCDSNTDDNSVSEQEDSGSCGRNLEEIPDANAVS